MKKQLRLFISLIIVVITILMAGTYSGGDGSSGNPYQISNLNDLSELIQTSGDWDDTYFIQTAHIDASETQYWDDADDDSDGDDYNDTNDGTSTGNNEGFYTIGATISTPFSASYDGQGYIISNLTINRSGWEYGGGLFGYMRFTTEVKNLGLTNVDITAGNYTGGLVGQMRETSSMTNCFVTGSVSAYEDETHGRLVGGLVGFGYNSTISNSFSTCTVTGVTNYFGGLVGNINTVTISNCFSTGNVVNGSSTKGGLVGYTTNSSISNCYSTGTVSDGPSYIGGLIGRSINTTVTNSFWDTETSGEESSAAGTGKTTAEMKTLSTFTDAGWDFQLETTNGTDDDWHIDDNGSVNSGYPYLSSQGRLVTISGSSDHWRMMSSPVAGTVYDDILYPLWIQGMTGGDVTDGTANVWTYDAANTEWDALSNLNTASLTAGQGFLVYVYTDTDSDGDDDLPVTLSVPGTENSGNITVPSSGSIDDAAWEFAGNPYATTIDWDDVTQTSVTTSAYVWDSQAGTPAYISWNSSAGSLTDGLIAPYQGFWVQGSGGTGSITIEEADKSSSAGTFYKTMADSTGSMSFTIASGDYSDQTFVSFMNNGEEGIDGSDTYKLLPMTPSERVVGISYADGNGLDINNLPYSQEGSIAIPLDVMYLTVDDDYNFVTIENDVTMSWDLSSLPETIIGLTLTDNTTNATTDLLQSEELTFTTIAKGSFPAYGSNGVNIYPQVGESQFTLSVAYSALTTNDDMMPKEFALHPAYPNPFNPTATITFDVPAQTHSNASLRIYDITGRLVATLVDEQLAPGTHTLQWQPVNLSSGLYIVQLKAGDQTFNQKITFIK